MLCHLPEERTSVSWILGLGRLRLYFHLLSFLLCFHLLLCLDLRFRPLGALLGELD